MAAAKKPVVVQERVKKSKPQIKVRIPKFVSSSSDKVWRRLMITAIREAAHTKKYSTVKDVTLPTSSKDKSASGIISSALEGTIVVK